MEAKIRVVEEGSQVNPRLLELRKKHMERSQQFGAEAATLALKRRELQAQQQKLQQELQQRACGQYNTYDSYMDI
jgi:hypothetical protein